MTLFNNIFVILKCLYERDTSRAHSDASLLYSRLHLSSLESVDPDNINERYSTIKRSADSDSGINILENNSALNDSNIQESIGERFFENVM